MRYGKNVNNGAVIKNFTWCGNNLIYEGDGNASDYLGKCYNYGYGLISSYDNNASAPTIYEKDGHGSVVMTLNSSYSNMSMPSYDAFGISSSALSSATDPMRYCGEYQDYESGLIYLRARYYNPQLGRFINEDPHWNPDNMVYGDSSQNTDVKSVPNYSAIIQSSNLYPYCVNNPVRFVDPSGNLIISTLAICLIAGAVSMGTVGGFIGNSLAEQNGIAGWEKAAYITGSTVAGAAIGATCGYLIAPAVASATGIAGVSVTASGVSFAASGTLTASAQRLYETTRTHIFSNDHISDGIMSLGTNEVDIFNRIYQIANDSSSKWQAGSNEIRTTINSVDATIRFFVENNEIININAFVGYSERVIGNLIK